MQGRNPSALVFMPKSSTPQSAHSGGMTHSASSPSFSTYSSLNRGNATASPQTLTQAMTLADGSSPMGSPGLSPTGSPLISHRKSPMSALVAAETAAAVNETLQVQVRKPHAYHLSPIIRAVPRY